MKKRLLLVLAVLTGMLLLTASIVWADTRFTDNGDGTVTDNLTGLMWAKDANLGGSIMAWDAAIDYSNSLSLGTEGCGSSYTDWRLPNRVELVSLLDLDNSGKALPSGHPFLNVQSDTYSSSTTSRRRSDFSWIVFMFDGDVAEGDKLNNEFPRYVWPVRGETAGSPAPVAKTGQTISYRTGDDGDLQKGVTWPDPRFTDNGDGTVTDNLTGLMWAKDANLEGGNVNILSLGSNSCGSSYIDWRLPNRLELESLLDLGNYNPALPSGHPFSDVKSSYWSSTYWASNFEFEWYMIMSTGSVGIDFSWNKSSYSLWPVRGGN